MAKKVNRLTDIKIRKDLAPGWYHDGAGLYLQVGPNGTKSWVYRYSSEGRERRQGLGAYPLISLTDARNSTKECTLLRKQGIDPIEQFREIKAANKAKEAKTITFRECAETFINSHKAGWKSKKHESQWRNTMQTYAYPVLEDIAVKNVDVGLVMKVLEPIWHEKTETASRVRQRIEVVLDWASARGYRSKENPARWRGHLDKLLPKRSKIQKVRHHKAVHYTEAPELFHAIRKVDSIAAKALAFTLLTGARSGESRGTKRSEIDGDIWTIPEDRMKSGRQHRVPLSKEAKTIVDEMLPYQRKDGLIFPGLRLNRPVSDTALLNLLRQHSKNNTVHGLRSTFRDWCAEQTNFPREVAEAALAHSLKDKTEAAYQRGDLFEKRRLLMNQWAQYCLSKPGKENVIPISHAGS